MKRKRDDENEEDFKTKISKSFLEFISEPVIEEYLKIPSEEMKRVAGRDIYNSQVKTLEDRFSVTVEFDEDTVLVSGPSRANIEDTLDSIAWMEKRLNDAELRKVEAIRARSEWMKKERK